MKCAFSECSNEVVITRCNKVYCSQTCNVKACTRRRYPKVERTCIECNTVFITTKPTANVCSLKSAKKKKVRKNKEYYAANPEHHRSQHKKWRSKNQFKVKKRQDDWQTEVKIAVLSEYGPEGNLQCCWNDCRVTDIDMLSLDHINNDGAHDKRGRGTSIYYALKNANYPPGFQTLCHNHQWKKELTRRRNKKWQNIQVSKPYKVKSPKKAVIVKNELGLS